MTRNTHGMNYSAIIRCYKGVPIDFSGWEVGRWYRLGLAGGLEVDTGEYQRQLGGGHFDGNGVVLHHGELKSTGSFESFVPDRQAVAIPIKDLETVATTIHEQEEMPRRGVLGKCGGHQPRERIKAFAEIGRRGVEKHFDGMGKADH